MHGEHYGFQRLLRWFRWLFLAASRGGSRGFRASEVRYRQRLSGDWRRLLHLESRAGLLETQQPRDGWVYFDLSPGVHLGNISGPMGSGRKQYPFHLIEPKWQRYWEERESFRAFNPGEAVPAEHPFAQRHAPARPEELTKYYILDMFPYPSGAGLHVGHPEGYTATDILARYGRARGLHVLHPMGWDAFGLPAEQYAIRTGQHPRKTTEANITTFKRQIKSLGFSYDWSRELDTTDPKYFRWTQWIFLKLYNSWFNPEKNKAEPIETLKYPAELKTEEQKRTFRDSNRLAFVTEAPVWWCEQLGTVLAN